MAAACALPWPPESRGELAASASFVPTRVSSAVLDLRGGYSVAANPPTVLPPHSVSAPQGPKDPYSEGYSGRPVEVQADNCRDGRLKCFEWAPVVGVHDGPVFEVRDHLLDHPSYLVNLGVVFLLPVE